MPVLLAPWLFQVVRVIDRPYHQDLLRRLGKHIGDIGAEGRVATPVLGHQMPVHPHPGGVVHRTEMQQQAFTRGLRGAEATPVPEDPVETRVADTAGPGLGRNGTMIRRSSTPEDSCHDSCQRRS